MKQQSVLCYLEATDHGASASLTNVGRVYRAIYHQDIAHAEGVASRHLHHERSVLKNRTGAIGDAAVTASDVLRRKRKQFSPDGVNNLEMSVRPMRYRACNPAHNAEVEMWAIFATRNSLKLHMMQKLFSTISNVRAITQKLWWQMTAASSVKPR